MEVTLLIEQGASKRNVAAAEKFKKEIESLSGRGEIFPLLKKIESVFPDTRYNGLSIRIAVPTAQKLCSPRGAKIAGRLIFGAYKELGWSL